MSPARLSSAVLVALLAGLVGWVLLDLWTGGGGTRPPISWATVAATVALPVVVLAAGWPVRRWVRGVPVEAGARRPRPVDPLVAARTAVLAKAAVYGGALLVGWYAAQAANLVPDLIGARRSDLVLSLLAAGAAVLLVVAGLVVQHWCRVPPEDGPGTPQGAAEDGGT